MDRLTIAGTREVKPNVTIAEAIAELTEYENTGLTPQQIVEIDHLYKEKCKELAKYKKLRQQGRAPILPCKIGQTVYAVAFNETKVIAGEVVSVRIGASGGSLRIYIPSDGQYIRRAFEQIGKSVFFSQAAAGEALAKRDGGAVCGDAVMVNGQRYSKRKLCLDWFKMSNDSFFQKYGFNFNPHEYAGLYDWGRMQIYGA